MPNKSAQDDRGAISVGGGATLPADGCGEGPVSAVERVRQIKERKLKDVRRACFWLGPVEVLDEVADWLLERAGEHDPMEIEFHRLIQLRNVVSKAARDIEVEK